jgi:hypothetical protein
MGTGDATVRRLDEFTRRLPEGRDVTRLFQQNGGTTWWTTPEDFARFRAEQATTLARLVRTAGAHVG